MDKGAQHIDYDLLTKYLVGEATPAEEAAVSLWLADSEANRAVLGELRQVLDTTTPTVDTTEVDTDAAWAKMQAKMHAGKRIQLKPTEVPKRQWRVTALAAIATGVLLVVAILFRYLPEETNTGQLTQITAQTETRSDTLPDGTVVALNVGSSLSYPVALDGAERRVKLTGEAFFEVEPDATRPFIIEVGEATVTVLGTSFNVDARQPADLVTVVVATGKVQLADKSGRKAILMPGDKGTYRPGPGELFKGDNTQPDYQFWRTGQLVFTNTALREVVDVLNRQYRARLSLESDAAASCQFTASFNGDSLETILHVLTATFKLQLEEGPSGRVLKGTACDGISL